MLLLIDNYDSFTFNISHYLQYLGAEVVVKRHDAITVPEIAELMPEQIVISPGPCTPHDAGISLSVIAEFGGQIPLLGICLGHQCIVQHFGGDIVRAKRIMHGKTSWVHHQYDPLFAHCSNPFEVMRYHSLIALPDTLPTVLDVIATTPYEEELEIMAVKHSKWPIWGVQFHPESIKTESGLQILKNFLTLSDLYRFK
jgi:para-aminobenzoate synthetase component II